MPELPEVETTRRGLAPHLVGRRIETVTVRDARLRRPVSPRLPATLRAQRILGVERRGKYLLLRLERGTLIIHLGMSGSLRVSPGAPVLSRHDHIVIGIEGGAQLVYRDPRRFGLLVWTGADPYRHVLLRGLGPEPLSEDLSAEYLVQRSRGRKQAVKCFIMDAGIVVGVGNIYANEALYLAGIHPGAPAGRVSPARYRRLAAAIKTVLEAAIASGGTTLRDFYASDGQAGWFGQQLAVYGRAGQPCGRCGRPVSLRRLGQRASYFCGHCQRW